MFFIIRYFIRELLPLGAIEDAHLSQFLTSWIDKNSFACMYTMFLIRCWSIAHLKACCWYIECGKSFCPVEEEDAKKACDQVDSQGVALGPNEGEVQEDEVEVDINLLPEKEKNKILNQRKGMPTRPRLRLIGRPRGPRTRRKGMPRKVGDQGSQRRWLPPLLHLCCHRFPLHYSHRIPASGILPIPIVYSPPTSVPVWNSADENFLPLVFDFGSSLVHDTGVLLFFHKDDLKLRADIKGYAKAYHFSIFKEWIGINRLPITSPRDASKTVSGSILLICFNLVITCI
jgi:hypothetical protein